jgi:hypothetical protein
MKRLITLVLIILFFKLFSNAQALPRPLPIVASNWERISVKDLGSFDLPPTMEVQSDKYRVFFDKVNKLRYYDTPQLTAQPIGVNDLVKEGLEKYARVMIETDIGKFGDFEKLNFNITEYTQADIAEMNNEFKQNIRQNLQQVNIKIIEWYPIKFETINGMSCIHISYKRQLNSNPHVLVHMYYFPNYDRMHTLTLSYRLSEVDYWKSDFAKILNSFRITNIKK